MSRDFVDALLDQWKAELPGERFEELGVFSRLTRYGRLAARTIYANIEQFGLNETQFNLLCALHRARDPYQLSPKGSSPPRCSSPPAPSPTSSTKWKTPETSSDSPTRSIGAALLDRAADLGGQTADRGEAARSHQQVCKELLAPLGSAGQKNLTNALRTLLVAIDDGPLPATSKHDTALTS